MNAPPAPRRAALFVDASILVSGIVFSGAKAELPALAGAGRYEALTSQYVMSQVRRVLLGKLYLPTAAVTEALDELPMQVCAEPPAALVAEAQAILRDPTDAPVLAAAWQAEADAPVTGDKDLLRIASPGRLRVIRSREALAMVLGGSGLAGPQHSGR